MEKIILFLFSFCAVLCSVSALECFVCDALDWNHHDCTHKRELCDTFQDSCTTYIRWGVPEKWSARGDRRYYISKGCDTRQGCERRQASTTTACKRDYYNDWACVECCVGDLCNYYVKLGAGTTRASLLMTISGAILVSFLLLWR